MTREELCAQLSADGYTCTNEEGVIMFHDAGMTMEEIRAFLKEKYGYTASCGLRGETKEVKP